MSERVADTLTWYPSQVSMPKASTTEEASATARDLIEALLHPGPASPLSPLSDSHRQALFQLAEIFSQATAEYSPSPPTVPVPTAPLPAAALLAHGFPIAFFFTAVSCSSIIFCSETPFDIVFGLE
eukprot:scaffold18746_cov41-Attheya_sp.AAC.4